MIDPCTWAIAQDPMVSLIPATNFRLTLTIMNLLLGRDNTKNFGKEFKCMVTTFLHSLDNQVSHLYQRRALK